MWLWEEQDEDLLGNGKGGRGTESNVMHSFERKPCGESEPSHTVGERETEC